MDEIERLVEETYKHFEQQFPEETYAHGNDGYDMREEHELREIPDGPGILYHLQRTTTVFVIRTLVSQNIRSDYRRVLDRPEEFPTLRLLEDGRELDPTERLRFFMVENPYQAEIIHDQLNNRRFPVNEESLCNLSDPGFSWWLTQKGGGFQISFTHSVSNGSTTVKLGPLGDQQLALRNFQALEGIITGAGLALSMENEMSRVQFAEGEEVLMEELRDLFEYGVVNENLTRLFKLLARRSEDLTTLETTWFYLQELAAMRRFWIQVQYDLGANSEL